MPLIIDNKSIERLNGPINIFILKPKDIFKSINQNYLILLGEEHNLKNYQQCFNDVNCSEVQTDFIKILNKFATTTRTDFYIESFSSIKKKDLSLWDPMNIDNKVKSDIRKRYIDSYENVQKIYYNLYNDPELRTLSKDDEKAKKKIKEYEELIEKNPARSRQPSIIHNIEFLYKSCFITKIKDQLCEYKNIKWHFSDARKYRSYSGESYNINNITEVLKDFSNFLLDYFDENNENIITEQELIELIENIGEHFESNTDVTTSLKNIKTMLTRIDLFIKELLDTRVFKKQLDKMDEYSKSIFTIDSFIQYIGMLKSRFFAGIDFDNLLIILELLIEYYEVCPEGNCENESKERSIIIIERLNKIKLNKELLLQYSYYAQGLGNAILDIYFILRIHKIDEGKINKKLVVSFFGAIHSETINYYFTEIVKTHDLIYFSENNENKYVTITDEINLNEFMEHIPIIRDTSIEYGGKTCKSKTYKSKSNKSKTYKSKTCKSKKCKSKTYKSKTCKSKTNKKHYLKR